MSRMPIKEAPWRLVLSRALLMRWTSQRNNLSYVALARASTAKSAWSEEQRDEVKGWHVSHLQKYALWSHLQSVQPFFKWYVKPESFWEFTHSPNCHSFDDILPTGAYCCKWTKRLKENVTYKTIVLVYDQAER